MSRRRITAVLLIPGSILCALMVSAGAWAAFAPLPNGSREVIYVVPKGNADRNGSSSGLPSRLRLTVCVRDILVLRNEDDFPASFGPALLEAGQTYRIPFHDPGEFPLACSTHPDGRISIVVVPAPPPGWSRLAWRLSEAVGP